MCRLCWGHAALAAVGAGASGVADGAEAGVLQLFPWPHPHPVSVQATACAGGGAGRVDAGAASSSWQQEQEQEDGEESEQDIPPLQTLQQLQGQEGNPVTIRGMTLSRIPSSDSAADGTPEAGPWRIGALGRLAGVEVETIRYYERIGLLPAPARWGNGYRAYGASHLERLAFIRHCRALDMSVADIRHLLDLMANPMADGAGVDALVQAQLDRVRARLASLHALERQLQALQGCCQEGEHAGRHLSSECPVLQELVEAARIEAGTRHASPPSGTEGVTGS